MAEWRLRKAPKSRFCDPDRTATPSVDACAEPRAVLPACVRPCKNAGGRYRRLQPGRPLRPAAGATSPKRCTSTNHRGCSPQGTAATRWNPRQQRQIATPSPWRPRHARLVRPSMRHPRPAPTRRPSPTCRAARAAGRSPSTRVSGWRSRAAFGGDAAAEARGVGGPAGSAAGQSSPCRGSVREGRGIGRVGD